MLIRGYNIIKNTLYYKIQFFNTVAMNKHENAKYTTYYFVADTCFNKLCCKHDKSKYIVLFSIVNILKSIL